MDGCKRGYARVVHGGTLTPLEASEEACRVFRCFDYHHSNTVQVEEIITTLEVIGYTGLLFFFSLYTAAKSQEGKRKEPEEHQHA